MANNWKETCARCKEGDVEPRYCEYYGEPNGCNSPIYGEHPSTPNAAAMHACLLKILAEMIDLGGMEAGRKARFSPDAIAEEIRQALSAPPRNCDVGTAEEQVARYHAFCAKMMKQNNHCCGPCPCHEFINGEAQSCTLLWAQMPYEEGGNDAD